MRTKLSLGVIDQALIDDYAIVSKDNNPIHLDTTYALEQGLPSTIAHGLLVMGMMVKSIEEQLAIPFTIKDYDVRFQAMVLVNDNLSVELETLDTAKNFTIKAINQRNEVVITGQVSIN